MTRLLLSLLLGAFLASAQAHTDEWMDSHASAHGGTTRMAGALHLELVRAATPTVYVTDHAGRAQDTDGARATLSIEQAEGRHEVQLLPAGENRLVAAPGVTLDAAVPVVLFIQLKDAPAETARFAPKSASREPPPH
jgi:hypothetical protein